MKKLIKYFLLKAGLYHWAQSFFSDSAVSKTMNEELPFFQKTIGSCELIFDIGANKGYYALMFSKISKRVIAAEPQPHLQKYLRSLAAWNKNILVESCAVSEKEGEIFFHVSTDDTISSASEVFIDRMKNARFKEHHWADKIKVKAITLDILIKKYGVPDFIKIDVEGYEDKVLEGLSHPVKNISFEYTREMIEVAAACINKIHSLSDKYKFNYTVVDNYYQMDLPEFITADEFIKTVIPKLSLSEPNGDIYALLMDTN